MKIILLSPLANDVGLSVVAQGFTSALQKIAPKTLLLTPIIATPHTRTTYTEAKTDQLLTNVTAPLERSFVEHLLSEGQEDRLLEYIVAHTQALAGEAQCLVIQGMAYTQQNTYATQLHQMIGKALATHVIFVTTLGHHTTETFLEQIDIAAQGYGDTTISGYIINKVGAPLDDQGNTRIDLFDLPQKTHKKEVRECQQLQHEKYTHFGCIGWSRDLIAPRTEDVAKHLKATSLNICSLSDYRITHFAVAGATLEHVTQVLNDHVLIITPADRSDVIMAACMAANNGTKIAGLLLTGGYSPPKGVLELCKETLKSKIPILTVPTDTLRTIVALQNLDAAIPTEDLERQIQAQKHIQQGMDSKALKVLLKEPYMMKTRSHIFRHQLLKKAKAAKQTIVLPEGEEPRVLQAACIAATRGIAHCLLLGNPQRIQAQAKALNIQIPSSVQILPPKECPSKYIQPLWELRKHKGMTEGQAKEAIKDPIVLATMMLQQGDAGGLVAGAITTTADTIRPAFQLIKTQKNASLVSSIFFMCLPEQVVIYGDCAINPNPTAEQLAEIAIQCAHSATTFGLIPRVAMISYSTGSSGAGADVQLVQKATELIQQRAPHLLVDGPLQYDAASDPTVAQTKAPHSAVAGKATVYVFPDLNTANTTYKAVQRSANVLSIGPILQGLNKPVNDLSRGATVEDILYTIAVTAVQSASL